MKPRYDAYTAAATSNVRHDSMTDIVFFEINRAVAETSLSESHLGALILCAYEDQVPESARSVNTEAPRESVHDYPTYSKLDTRAQKRLRDYKNGVIPLPADMVRPALSVLPEPYSSRGLRKIVRYLGFVGAEQPDAVEAGTDCDLLARISRDSGEVMRWLVKALADGVLDEHDAALAPNLCNALDELASEAVATKARICVRTGYAPQKGGLFIKKPARPGEAIERAGGSSWGDHEGQRKHDGCAHE